MKMLRLLLATLLMLSLVSCSQTQISIYVTAYPLEYVAQRLAGEEVVIENISSGSIASRSTINKSALNRMSEDDIVFRIAQLEPYLDLYTSQIQKKGVQIVDLAATSSSHLYNSNNKEVQSTTLNQSGTDLYRQDTYLWMDPIILSSMAATMRDTLIDRLPDYEQLFNERYDELKRDLIKLDAAYQRLADSQSIRMLSMTPTFTVWSQSYNIDVYPVVLSRFGVLPSASQLSAIEEVVIQEEIHYLVVEPILPTSMVELSWQISNNLSLTRVSLHDLFMLSDSDRLNGHNYLSIMYQNLETLLVLAESS